MDFSICGASGSRSVTFDWRMGAFNAPSDGPLYSFSATFYEAQPGRVFLNYFGTTDQGISATIGMQGTRAGVGKSSMFRPDTTPQKILTTTPQSRLTSIHIMRLPLPTVLALSLTPRQDISAGQKPALNLREKLSKADLSPNLSLGTAMGRLLSKLAGLAMRQYLYEFSGLHTIILLLMFPCDK
jgi:hypothetical protein